jgi:dUTP pyrophosphatase
MVRPQPTALEYRRFLVTMGRMNTTTLTDEQIRAGLRHSPPLIEGLKDEASQIQPCGVDLTVRTVSRFVSRGAIDFDNSGRVLALREEMPWLDGAIDLPVGSYHIVYNERVNLPSDIMALAYPRSTLLRCGVTIYTAVWDPGYSGRAEALLVVHNTHGFRITSDARVAQLVFTVLGAPVGDGYAGRYSGENPDP